MIVALIDNGSLEPAAQHRLRAVAAALSKNAGLPVHAVSWKHSDRLPIASLAGVSAWTLAPFVRAHLALDEREFLFVPFFISAQGAIGSALRADLEKLWRDTGGFSFRFAAGLAARDTLAPIVADRVRETLAAGRLSRPAVILVDHGGPSPASAALRDSVAARLRTLLVGETGPIAAASMEGAHGPLLSDQLAAPGFDRGEIIVAPLFLAPGRHAGPERDVSRICRAAPAKCHLTGLVGDHPAVVETLGAALRDELESTVPAEAAPHVN